MKVKTSLVLVGVHEYNEGLPVEIVTYENGRRTLKAVNQGGFDSTEIDLDEVLYKLGYK